MENLTMIDKIDRYLAGVMSEDEKQAFEEKMRKDKYLKRDVDVQREAIRQIRLQAMMEKMKQFDRRARFRTIAQNVSVWTVRILSPIAIAACLIGFIVVGPQVNNMKQINAEGRYLSDAHIDINEAYNGLKGCDEAAALILSADQLMQQGKFKEADEELKKALKELGEVSAENKQAWETKEDILFMRALCAIERQQLYRSRALLCAVVNMHSTHETIAAQLLKQIKTGIEVQ